MKGQFKVSVNTFCSPKKNMKVNILHDQIADTNTICGADKNVSHKLKKVNEEEKRTEVL